MDYITAFHDIIYDQKLTFHNKVSSLLQLGQEVFSVDVGFIAHVRNRDLSVLFLESHLSFQKIESIRVPLNAFGKEVIAEGATTTGKHDDGASRCLFIGTPLFYRLETLGVIAFASTRRSRKFSERHVRYLEMFAKWYGNELAYQHTLDRYEQRVEMFNQLESVARIGTWEVDLIANKLSWSDQTKLIHQVPMDYEPNLETAIKFYKEGYSREAISKAIEDAITTGKPWQLELELLTGNNKSIWVKANGIAEFVANECVRLYGTFHDISHEVIIREELKAELQEFRHTVD
ncbi:GAF domain-containing protein [Alteromonas ponticola]|uniref:GAF domain-containing protein n=1 Tax=Alteromonas ponticola TaxID=2720613 RepID=A0ABX1R3Z4_9ALTE|nr:GAF domain-containing protein [Alteromonas ponticola]NMH59968.1 GAF domain-containing protein [Alteromonas ponticola]